MPDPLPLVTLYLSERCNSRCATCDYWRHGVKDTTLEQVERLLPALEARRTRTIVLSGGEPLINPQWREIAALLKSRGIGLWLLTSGLSLAKHAQSAAALFHSVTVSLDGTCAGLRRDPRPRCVRQGLRGYRSRRGGGQARRAARHAAALELPRAASVRDARARARRRRRLVPGGRREQRPRLRAPRGVPPQLALPADDLPRSTAARGSSASTRRIFAPASSRNPPRSCAASATISPRLSARRDFRPCAATRRSSRR